MDEPTSVLTPQEAERLFQTLRRLAGEGCAILYISHKLDEIRALCDEATILRQGRVVATCDPRRETTERLAGLMIGGDIKPPAARRHTAAAPPRLAVTRLGLPATRQFGTDLSDISFTVGGGEIFGIGGMARNSHVELMEAPSRETRADPADAIRIDGVAAGPLGIRARRALGACFAPEAHYGHAAISGITL